MFLSHPCPLLGLIPRIILSGQHCDLLPEDLYGNGRCDICLSLAYHALSLGRSWRGLQASCRRPDALLYLHDFKVNSCLHVVVSVSVFAVQCSSETNICRYKIYVPRFSLALIVVHAAHRLLGPPAQRSPTSLQELLVLSKRWTCHRFRL
ncbi:hypothetical protein PsYK624_011080 [Phanerochaete sordida]|uniref:Uncharacterized protein n=1 Tax=Phanerochaete sordida TaxID=48140 RepID=A0A9P3L7G1_9APHY|nr:hypothetical protein PsYK624_011080 [Phanerochaete sordida]